jgi:hypothetical protein
MKTLPSLRFIWLLAAFLSLSTLSWAQSSQSEVQLIRNLWGNAKEELVRQYMDLNPEEADKFWPVYEAYTSDRGKLGTERIAIIEDYARNYTTLTDSKIDKLTQRLFKNELQLDKLQQKYYGKMKKALSPMRASQFMQLEKYLQTMIRYELQNNLPFIGELDRKRGT